MRVKRKIIVKSQLNYSVVIFILVSFYATFLHWKLGMDGLWDSANYHFYIGWVASSFSIYKYGAIAQYHSYLNPILDVINYLSFSYHPYLGALFHTVSLSISAVILGKIYTLNCNKNKFTSIYLAVSLAIGLSSAMTVSLFGSLTNEHLVAIPILAALYILIKNIEINSLVNFFYVGLLTGLALGLKLTVAHYVVGIILATVISTRFHLKTLVVTCLGIGAGFLFVDGFFMFQRWLSVENPIFPFANNIFNSPYYPNVWKSFSSFDPHRIFYYFSLPIIWLFSGDFSESPVVRDGRILLAYLGIVFFGFNFFAKRSISKKNIVLVVFFLASWITWILVFRIYRYLVVLEMLSGIIFVIGINEFFEKPKKRVSVVLIVTLVIFLGYVTVYPDWGRRNWSDKFYTTNINDLLPQDGPRRIFFADERLSYLAPQLKKFDTTFGNLFSQSWWDGDREGNPLDPHSLNLYEESPTYFLQYSVFDPRLKSAYFNKLFSGSIYKCRFVTSNLLWSPYLCMFQKPKNNLPVLTGHVYSHNSDELMFVSGWAFPEQNLRRSDGTKSQIWLRLPTDHNSVCNTLVSLKGISSGNQRININAKDKSLFAGNVVNQFAIHFVLPKIFLKHEELIKLNLNFPDAISPGNGDSRILAIGLKSISFDCI